MRQNFCLCDEVHFHVCCKMNEYLYMAFSSKRTQATLQLIILFSFSSRYSWGWCRSWSTGKLYVLTYTVLPVQGSSSNSTSPADVYKYISTTVWTFSSDTHIEITFSFLLSKTSSGAYGVQLGIRSVLMSLGNDRDFSQDWQVQGSR